ncbi:YopX family protein [Enterococcus phoeniculicola]|uniref:YopX protein domain-containing protein n=1 Tax=Enterococcus phoeniculicola ATCC BAA-412 TaxID=1158610 RepID=R3WJH7_9ENTE|nr:YopX family protein [Enterococcus phoeniculicola]EOL42020.1 hypothetical protein UC3_02368 [Enterococcus phoeniculicola ATCC BAA-412]EOT79701.1 hypothetical protein I589_01213 [Enterococcus phoeniculicola ATCC BAA-412]
MREIKFRGKPVDPSIGDRWLTGFGVAVVELSEEYSKKVGYSKEVYLYTEGGIFQVSEESVGQYTGLIDRNDKEICIGDYWQAVDRLSEKTFKGLVYWLNGCIMFDNWNAHEFLNRFQFIEITGNVIDQFNMLKESGTSE